MPFREQHNFLRSSDVDVFHDFIDAEVKDGWLVLRIVHSYGSVPASGAVRDFSTTGMVELMVLTGILLGVGESLETFSKGESHPVWIYRVVKSPCRPCEMDLQQPSRS
jgi:hypothetical protein